MTPLPPNSDMCLPGIYEQLEKSNLDPIKIKNQFLLELLQAKTGLDPQLVKTLTEMFFQELRNGMLRGDIIDLRGLGRLLITNPHNSGNVYISPKVRNHKSLIKKINKET